jgi:hypothetical protein
MFLWVENVVWSAKEQYKLELFENKESEYYLQLKKMK